MSDEPIEILGENFIHCDPAADGVPRCKLGKLTEPDKYGRRHKPRTIHMKGACAWDVLRKERPLVTGIREYDIMCIGDGVQREDDEAGMPMVGRAGDQLMHFIAAAGLDLERVYITNIVKCIAPNGRKAATGELKQCLTHIYHEIREINPKVIVLMGAGPLKLFNLDKIGGITKIRGKMFKKALPHWEDGPEYKIIPTPSPAMFLYRDDPKLKARVMNDFVFANGTATTENIEDTEMLYEIKYEVADTVAAVRDMVDQIKEKKIFAFDTESPDLHFMDNPMRLLQMSIGKGKTWVVPFYKHDPNALGLWQMAPWFKNGEREKVVSILSEVFENVAIAVVGHNLKYDMNVMKRWTGLACTGMLWDTAIMHHLLYEYPPHRLEYLADIELGTGDYSFKVREIVGHGKDLIKTYDCIPDEILYPYGATDAEATFLLMESYFPRLAAKAHLMKLYMEESYPTIQSLQEFEWVGNHIIVENVKTLETSLTSEIDDLVAKCREHTPPDFNPGSPDQVTAQMIKLGFAEQVKEPTKAKGFSTAKDVLTEIDHPLAENVIKYRNRKKMLSTYVERVLKDINKDGRVRYGFNPSGPTNGRLSCTLLHQMPRIDQEKVDQGAAVLRSIFGEDEDYFYLYGDFSQIELRIFAYLTGERELIEYLETGKDIHRLNAAAALEIAFDDVSDMNRSNIGKPISFGAIYGSKGTSIAKSEYEHPKTGKKHVIGKFKAAEMVLAFRRRYTKVDEYLISVPEDCLCNGGIIKSVFGRERRMMGLNDPYKGVREAAEREVTNFTISSPAAAITLRTINMVREVLKENNVGLDLVRPLNTVHDSIAYGVHKSMIDWFGPVLKAVAERPIPELYAKIFPLKYGVGKTWTEAELNAA